MVPMGGVSTIFFLLFLSLSFPFFTTVVVCQAPPKKCPDKCGNVSIPYPFGTSGGCSMDETFILACNDTHYVPPKPFWGDHEVLEVSAIRGEVVLHLPISIACYNETEEDKLDSEVRIIDLKDLPFTYSKLNKFMQTGCAPIARLEVERRPGKMIVKGCSSVCGDTTNFSHDGVRCSAAVGCCQSTIPSGFKYFSLQFRRHSTGRKVTWNNNTCGLAFIADPKRFLFDKTMIEHPHKQKEMKVAVILDWSLERNATRPPPWGSSCRGQNSEALPSKNGLGYLCSCSDGFEGNPYLEDGCKAKDVCKFPEIHRCPNGSTCVNVPDGGGYACMQQSTTIGVITASICGGLCILVVIGGSSLCYETFKKKKAKKLRHAFFSKNFRLLSDKMDNVDEVLNMRTFSLKEMGKATNNFDTARILGGGGQGVIYKGLLSDKRVVAIKKFKERKAQKDGGIGRQIAQYINEIAILSPIDHRNVVKLLGCCLENEVPILVYEFISNGTLSDYLHVWNRTTPFSWDDRLRIATEIATAVTYLHSAASKFILHRDLKSSNILLDERLNVKVLDFGASKSLTIDQSHVTTVVQGTFGYLDPEYHRTGRLTEKSDVYSLGVILVELLAGEKLFSVARSPEEKYLIPKFIAAMEENQAFQIVEASIKQEERMAELEVVAKLARACLREHGGERPTMREVATILQSLRKTMKKQNAQNLPELKACEEHNETSMTQFSYIEEIMESMSFPR